MGEKKEMNVYLYVIMITSVTALVLSLLYTSLNPIFEANKAEAKKAAILSCIPDSTLDLTNIEEVALAYADVTMYAVNIAGDVYTDSEEDLAKINGMAINGAKKYGTLAELELANEEKKAEKDRIYPVYERNGTYVVAIRGNGLWDKIWGYIALENDLNTIAGVYFDHKNETPGLGAEIKDNSAFKQQFIGKKIFEGNHVALTVLKRPKKGEHYVTGISGATITCDGVTKMFEKGMSKYETYFESLKNKK
ncbi:MAG: Na+-transporting NADH:ubiquinone oxidoreductase subunit C [Aureispira sp.]|jgi:Na+-transporting NADH:ubiquinone oxidoreductase subunit C